jgi:hypothetical protein
MGNRIAARHALPIGIYALSKNTGLPRSATPYPTLAGEAADQVVRLKDPVLGDKRAEIICHR